MTRYKLIDRSLRLLPVVLSEQIVLGTFEFALDQLVDRDLDLSGPDVRFDNDETGTPGYDFRMMTKIVLLGCIRGMISFRSIEQARHEDVAFIALSGDCAPSFTHIAKYAREVGGDLLLILAQVLMVCGRLGLIGTELFAIDVVKLPANASKESSGTHQELVHRSERLDMAEAKCRGPWAVGRGYAASRPAAAERRGETACT